MGWTGLFSDLTLTSDRTQALTHHEEHETTPMRLCLLRHTAVE